MMQQQKSRQRRQLFLRDDRGVAARSVLMTFTVALLWCRNGAVVAAASTTAATTTTRRREGGNVVAERNPTNKIMPQEHVGTASVRRCERAPYTARHHLPQPPHPKQRQQQAQIRRELQVLSSLGTPLVSSSSSSSSLAAKLAVQELRGGASGRGDRGTDNGQRGRQHNEQSAPGGEDDPYYHEDGGNRGDYYDDNYYYRDRQDDDGGYGRDGRRGNRGDDYYHEDDDEDAERQRRYYDDYYGDVGGGRRGGPSSAGPGAGGMSSSIMSSLPSVVRTGDRKIGLPMLGSGIIITMLGVTLFFNKTLMRLGNLLFIMGVPMTIGPSRTMNYFIHPNKVRATSCLALGIFLVLVGRPVLGIALEVFGLLNLFGNMFPLVWALFKQMPGVSTILKSAGSNNNGRGNRSGRTSRTRVRDQDYYYDDDYYYDEGSDKQGGRGHDEYYYEGDRKNNDDDRYGDGYY